MEVVTENSFLNDATVQGDSIQRSFARALAIHSLGEHDELLPWLYWIVETHAEQLRLEKNEGRDQRLVGRILRATFSRLPPDAAELLVAIDLGGETVEAIAQSRVVGVGETSQLLQDARAQFVALLRSGAVPLSLASHG